MFKGIWRPVSKWWQSLVGTTPQKALAASADLPPLTDPDYEYLFMQLLEGVSHGWQQPRAIEFFRKIKQRAPRSQWIAWMKTFGDRLVNSPTPNEELARRMIQLGDLDCGEVTSLAGDYGHQILGKIYGNISDEEYLAEMMAQAQEMAAQELADQELSDQNFVADSSLEDSFEQDSVSDDLTGFGFSGGFNPEEHKDVAASSPPLELPLDLPASQQEAIFAEDFEAVTTKNSLEDDFVLPEPMYKSRQPLANLVEPEDDFPTFGEVPADLRLGSTPKKAVPPPPPPSGFLQPIDLEETKVEQAAEPAVEQQEISIEEFAAMLQSDPDLLRDISQQLGIETTDPQVVVDTVIAQMQEQIANGQS
jgi:hypothetical protein